MSLMCLMILIKTRIDRRGVVKVFRGEKKQHKQKAVGVLNHERILSLPNCYSLSIPFIVLMIVGIRWPSERKGVKETITKKAAKTRIRDWPSVTSWPCCFIQFLRQSLAAFHHKLLAFAPTSFASYTLDVKPFSSTPRMRKSSLVLVLAIGRRFFIIFVHFSPLTSVSVWLDPRVGLFFLLFLWTWCDVNVMQGDSNKNRKIVSVELLDSWNEKAAIGSDRFYSKLSPSIFTIIFIIRSWCLGSFHPVYSSSSSVNYWFLSVKKYFKDRIGKLRIGKWRMDRLGKVDDAYSSHDSKCIILLLILAILSLVPMDLE